MQIKYGTYAFNSNDASLTSTREVLRSDSGVVIGYKEMWMIRFRLRGDTQAEITTATESFFSAFNVNGKDLVLLDNNGDNSAFIIDSSSSTSGTQVKNIRFDLRDAQYTTFLDGEVELEAEFITGSQAASLAQYQESFSVRGNGGPRNVIIETAVGLPVIQQTRQRTAVRATQSGFAIGRGFVPTANRPYFPGFLVNEEEAVTESVSYDSGVAVWRVEWNYQFQNNKYFAQRPIGI